MSFFKWEKNRCGDVCKLIVEVMFKIVGWGRGVAGWE